MESTRFDRLTKALAGAASRRQALKALTVAAVGGVIGVRSAGTAHASGNSACAHFCDAVFGDDTRAARQCTRDAAHGFGLCYTCGPASPGGGVAPSAICCTRTRHGHCERYDDAACCGSGQTCQHGNCVTIGSTTTHAPGRTTTRAPGLTTTQAPGLTTTQAPGLTTTQAPGLTTTHAPRPTTTQAPGLTTTQAPGLTMRCPEASGQSIH